MQLNEVEFQPFEEFGEDFAHPDFPGFDFIIVENAFENVDHLSLDHHFSNLFADNRNEPTTGYFRDGRLVGFAQLQNLCFESGDEGLAVGVDFEEELQNLCERLIGRRVEVVETLKSHFEDFIKIRKGDVFFFF
jgi:hypothetical protein